MTTATPAGRSAGAVVTGRAVVLHPPTDRHHPRRPHVGDVPGRARPDDRLDVDPHDRGRPQRPEHPGLGDDRLPHHLDDRRRRCTASSATSTAAGRTSSSRSPSSSSARRCPPVRALDVPARRLPRLQGIGAGGLFSLALTIIGDIVAAARARQVPGLLPGRLRHLERARPGHRRFLRRRRHDPRHRRLALGLPRSTCRSASRRCSLVVRTLHLPHTRRDHRIDFPGALALVVGLVPMLIIAEQGRDWGWTSAQRAHLLRRSASSASSPS